MASVLVIDDDAAFRGLARRMLADCGLTATPTRVGLLVAARRFRVEMTAAGGDALRPATG